MARGSARRWEPVSAVCLIAITAYREAIASRLTGLRDFHFQPLLLDRLRSVFRVWRKSLGCSRRRSCPLFLVASSSDGLLSLRCLLPARWLRIRWSSTHGRSLIDGRGWTTLLSSDDLDDWRLRVGELLGPHEVRAGDAAVAKRFHHRIRSASAGPLQLVEFRGVGSFALERIQAPDRAVLWLPSLGVVEERVEGCTLQPQPGMGLWIRPNTALVGRIQGECGGISIVVPTSLLQVDEEQGYRVDAEAGSMLLNPFSRQRSSAAVQLLRLARQLVETVEAGGTGFTLRALTEHLIDQLQAWDRIAPRSSVRLPRAEQHCRDAEDWILRHRDRPFSVADVAAALHISKRTLQASFRAERDMNPGEAIQRLRYWPPPE